jgi:hypothetical protein
MERYMSEFSRIASVIQEHLHSLTEAAEKEGLNINVITNLKTAFENEIAAVRDLVSTTEAGIEVVQDVVQKVSKKPKAKEELVAELTESE